MANNKILVVEDEMIISMELSHRLKRSGYEVVGTAATGEDAIQKANEFVPDLILMDIHINGDLDGIQTAEIIHSTQDTPVIYLTAFSDEKTLARAKLTTPYGFIIKPFEQRELEISIEVALYKRSVELKQRETEYWLDATLTNINDGIITTDESGVVNYVNKAALFKLNSKKEYLFGNSVFDLFKLYDYKSRLEIENPIRTILRNNNGEIRNKELVLKRHDNTTTIIEATTSLIHFDKGKISGAVFVFRDISERKTAEEALKKSQERYRAVVEQINDGIILHDIETLKIISSNSAYQRMTGYTEEELEHLTAYDLTSTNQDRNGDYISEVIKFKNIIRGERKERRKDGTLMDSEVTLSLISYLNKEVVCIIVRDITEKKKTDILIKETELRYRHLFEAMAQGVVYQDSEGNIISANPAAYRILGLSDNEFIGRLSIDPKWRSIHKRDPNFEGDEHPSILALQTGKRVSNITLRVYHPKDKSHRWIILEAVPEFRENETIPHRIFTTFTDITEQKLTLDELKKSQENLKELNATKDKFFSIVAHDLKSPFQGLLGFSNLLAENYDDLLDEEVKKISNNIYKATKNLFSLIEHLLSWSRLQTNRMECNIETLELRAVVIYVVNLITPNAIAKSISLEDNIGEEISVLADERMLSSVLENLVTNAIKFTRKGGAVTISASIIDDFIEICVSDTGVGIPKEDLDKLFRIDHTHTMKGTDGEIGTGLGLILCHEMIQKLGGTIWVQSEVDRGTSIYFTLPKA
ncbi:MAG: hypothetical protein CVV24_12910 [Ignavibacteriae bacterium HGW-Ignavibacteriae-3]|nr:MAG: hypothetical protein CVV24_12910 [Ignavibacteriae bacterium HGW-Ignavibacteriae-3]